MGDTEGDLIRKPSNISKHFKAIIARAGVEHIEAEVSVRNPAPYE